MDIITGYTGTPHITAENDRDINIGIFGSKSYVLQTGTMLTAEISNNNEIKVRDGVIMHQGCAASIKKNTYDSVAINNGSQGMKRIDLIVARYEKQPETNVESLTLKVLQGTPAEESPQVPAHTEGDIRAGDTVADMPLYEIEIDGLNITEVRKVFKTIEDFESLNGKLEDTIIVNTYTKDNISVSANSYASVAVNAPVISGYNRVMWQTSIYNATTGGTHVTNCWITSATVTTGNDNMNVMITNSGGTQAKLKVIVKMLYVKTKA